MGLIEDIGAEPVGLDTAIFIYLIEEHPRFLPLVESVFAAVDRGRWSGVTSGVTLMEVLVVPYRAGDLALAERIRRGTPPLRATEVPGALGRVAARATRALTPRPGPRGGSS